MVRLIPEMRTVAGFSMIKVGIITGGLYYGHASAPELLVGAWPSIWYGFVRQLPLNQRYPLEGMILVVLPCIWAAASSLLLPYSWGATRYMKPPQRHPGSGRSLLTYNILFWPKLLLSWCILPLEGTPFVLLLLESGLVMIVSYFALFKQELPDEQDLKDNKEFAAEYIKLRHDDNKTSLTVAVGSGFSIILTLLVGSVTFFYSEVLRFGLEDARGLFPYYQTITIVILAAILMIEWAYALVYRFYKEMTLCTELLWKISS